MIDVQFDHEYLDPIPISADGFLLTDRLATRVGVGERTHVEALNGARIELVAVLPLAAC